MKPVQTLPEPASTAKHTPGPWEVRHYAGKTEVRAIGDSQTMGHTWIVAEVFGDTGETFRGHGSPEANARLIASAPDLLAALEELVTGHSMKGEEMGRAAIAKAKAAQ